MSYNITFSCTYDGLNFNLAVPCVSRWWGVDHFFNLLSSDTFDDAFGGQKSYFYLLIIIDGPNILLFRIIQDLNLPIKDILQLLRIITKIMLIENLKAVFFVKYQR